MGNAHQMGEFLVGSAATKLNASQHLYHDLDVNIQSLLIKICG